MGFKEAEHYIKLANKKTHCILCPHSCIIGNGETGKCLTRQNINGNLKSMFYAKPHIMKYISVENAGLFHFMPGKQSLNIAIAGENLIDKTDEYNNEKIEKIPKLNQNPMQVIEEAKKTRTEIIVYNYCEPMISYEYVKDIAEKSKEIKNAIITNGFANDEPIREISKLIKAANIEIESMSDEFYTQKYGAKLQTILSTIKTLRENNVWVEITMKLDERHTDLYEVRKFISWVLNNLGADTPIHFISNNNLEIIKKAKKLALGVGINYVYTKPELEDQNATFCPNCKNKIIERGNKEVKLKIQNSQCSCGKNIAGIWEF